MMTTVNADQFLVFSHALPEAFYIITGSGKIIAANPAATRMLGLKSVEILGKKLEELVTDPIDKINRYLKNCSKSKELVPGTLQWRQTNHDSITTSCIGSLLTASSDSDTSCIILRCTEKTGSNSKFAFLNSELSALRTKHHKVMDEKERLEEIVVQRTAALAKHVNELERVNQELDQFAYVTSHDLKAPLRAIANLSEWIEEDIGEQFTEETHEQMTLLRGRVRRMEGLIDGILQYSRVGRVEVEPETIDVKNLLDEVFDSLAPAKEFSVEIESNMPTLKSDRLRLSQVFANLVSNAIKYHDRLDGHIRVGVNDLGEFYEFSVADDGPGIDPKYHEKIFEIFQTLQARDKVESTGVGLTLVKKIINEHGGKIRVESVEGEGANFIFTWPKQPKKGDE